MSAINQALDGVQRLHAKCCDPGRSPRMETLAATIADARDALGADDQDRLDRSLEAAGAQVGALQVACCAPGRMEIYVEVLDNLSQARRTGGTAMH